MSITILDGSSPLRAGWRDALLDCWVEVSNAGGAVGFPFPPVSPKDVQPVLDRLLDDLAGRRVVLAVAGTSGDLSGWVALRPQVGPLVEHVGLVERLQTHPDHRGRGLGAALLDAVEEYAATSTALRQLHLTVRGGMGLEPFYERRGWTEVGRWPGALRLGPEDFRDDVLMFKALPTA